MALFRRKKDSALPEVDQYYEAERRDRAGLAWLLALASIIVVVLLVTLLFLGGRWIYNQITDNNGNETPVAINDTDVPSFDGAPDNEETNGATDDGDENGSEGSVDAPARTDTPSTPTTQTPTTGDDPLPNSGPTGLLSAFVGTSVLAGTAHYAVSRKRLNS